MISSVKYRKSFKNREQSIKIKQYHNNLISFSSFTSSLLFSNCSNCSANNLLNKYKIYWENENIFKVQWDP